MPIRVHRRPPFAPPPQTGWRRRILAGVACAACAVWPVAHAQKTAQQAVPTVTVPGTRDPVDKSYRKMIKGMNRFQRDHALAPDASLRFRLLPRQKELDMRSVSLKIVGDKLSLPVPLAADQSFTLPRNAQALREDASLIANRKTTSMTWRAMVRSPGLAPDTRRLGDLRLECRVGVEAGLISNDPALIAWLTSMLHDPDRVCSIPNGEYLFFTERPLFSVTLRAGARSEVLPFYMLYAGGQLSASALEYCDCQVLLDRSYYAPLWDQSWPDDTVLEFEYMDQQGAP